MSPSAGKMVNIPLEQLPLLFKAVLHSVGSVGSLSSTVSSSPGLTTTRPTMGNWAHGTPPGNPPSQKEERVGGCTGCEGRWKDAYPLSPHHYTPTPWQLILWMWQAAVVVSLSLFFRFFFLEKEKTMLLFFPSISIYYTTEMNVWFSMLCTCFCSRMHKTMQVTVQFTKKKKSVRSNIDSVGSQYFLCLFVFTQACPHGYTLFKPFFVCFLVFFGGVLAGMNCVNSLLYYLSSYMSRWPNYLWRIVFIKHGLGVWRAAPCPLGVKKKKRLSSITACSWASWISYAAYICTYKCAIHIYYVFTVVVNFIQNNTKVLHSQTIYNPVIGSWTLKDGFCS